MNLQDLIDELQRVADRNPDLLEQPVSCFFSSKSMDFDIDRVYSRIDEDARTAETIINIS